MKRKIFLIIACLLVLFSVAACSSSPVVSSAAEPVRSLSSSGTGEVYLVPDVAYIYVGVQVEADEVSVALESNNVQANAVAEAVKALGIEAKDIQTSSFNVYPMQDYDNNGQVSRKYYVVDNTVYITVRDLTKLGDMLDAVAQAGANSINSITFDVADKNSALAEARDLAIKNAITEAEAIAAASGVKLGDIQSINVSTNNNSTPVYAAKGGGMMDSAASSVPVSAGQLLLTATADIVYEIQ